MLPPGMYPAHRANSQKVVKTCWNPPLRSWRAISIHGGVTDHLLPHLLPDPSSLLRQPSRWQTLSSAKRRRELPTASPARASPAAGSSGTSRLIRKFQRRACLCHGGCGTATHVLSYQNKLPQEDFFKVPSWLPMPKPPLLACAILPPLTNKNQTFEGSSVLNTQNHFTHTPEKPYIPQFDQISLNLSRLTILPVLCKLILQKTQFSL